MDAHVNDAISENEAIYDRLWTQVPLVPHQQWPIWPALQAELAPGDKALELGCGTLPRVPVEGGYFADLSRPALGKLQAQGGHAVRAAGPLPFPDGVFQVVCAFEVLEHIPDDKTAMAEIARVLRPGGVLFLSVPVNPQLFTAFDTVCGHVRRYDARALQDQLQSLGLSIERWATQTNNYGPVTGAAVAGAIRALGWFPRLLVRVKRQAVQNHLGRPYVWQQGPIEDSHRAGGLIAVARRLPRA